MSVSKAVEATVAALALEESDAALVELAQAYARELDGAAAAARRADKAVQEAALHGDEEHVAEVEALRKALSARVALEKLGRELRATLVELHATPKARGGFRAAPVQSAIRQKLGELRAVQ